MPHTSRETVLYIDDDTDDQEFFVTGLAESRPDIQCYLAKDSKTALELIQTIPVPNYIFIDLHLPRVNGIELLKMIKSMTTHATTPVYVLSNSLFEPYALTIKEVGGAGFLRKPSTLQDFRLMFDTVLTKS